MDWLISLILIVSGVAILVYSLSIATRIIGEFPRGIISSRWKALRLLIVLFIAGYLSYLCFLAREHILSNLIVSVIFFFGAVFVMWVCSLTLNTVQDLNRLDDLQTESITDELTGVFNRRHLERCLELEIVRAQTLNTPLSLLMLDLDRYKDINDKYGHQAGDEMLKCIGHLLQQVTRRMDIVARYGGDEIAVILPNTGHEVAQAIADRIRLTVQEKSTGLQGQSCRTKDIHCTVSIGIATLPEHRINGTQLLEMADAALYQAKEAGRNCVVMYQADRPYLSVPA
jgi:diguanylate cyclase (GGDEF)-like protein